MPTERLDVDELAAEYDEERPSRTSPPRRPVRRAVVLPVALFVLRQVFCAAGAGQPVLPDLVPRPHPAAGLRLLPGPRHEEAVSDTPDTTPPRARHHRAAVGTRAQGQPRDPRLGAGGGRAGGRPLPGAAAAAHRPRRRRVRRLPGPAGLAAAARRRRRVDAAAAGAGGHPPYDGPGAARGLRGVLRLRLLRRLPADRLADLAHRASTSSRSSTASTTRPAGSSASRSTSPRRTSCCSRSTARSSTGWARAGSSSSSASRCSAAPAPPRAAPWPPPASCSARSPAPVRRPRSRWARSRGRSSSGPATRRRRPAACSPRPASARSSPRRRWARRRSSSPSTSASPTSPCSPGRSSRRCSTTSASSSPSRSTPAASAPAGSTSAIGSPLRLLARSGYHFLSLGVIVFFLAIDVPPFRAVVYATGVAALFGLLEAVLSRRPVVSGFDDPDYELERMALGESVTRLRRPAVRGALDGIRCGAAGDRGLCRGRRDHLRHRQDRPRPDPLRPARLRGRRDRPEPRHAAGALGAVLRDRDPDPRPGRPGHRVVHPQLGDHRPGADLARRRRPPGRDVHLLLRRALRGVPADRARRGRLGRDHRRQGDPDDDAGLQVHPARVPRADGVRGLRQRQPAALPRRRWSRWSRRPSCAASPSPRWPWSPPAGCSARPAWSSACCACPAALLLLYLEPISIVAGVVLLAAAVLVHLVRRKRSTSRTAEVSTTDTAGAPVNP